MSDDTVKVIIKKGSRRGGKKGRKINKNKKWCENYLRTGRREVNKKKKLLRHRKKHPNDVNPMINKYLEQ